MWTHTTDQEVIDTLRSMLLDNPVGTPCHDATPARRVFVGEDGNLHYSVYDANGRRQDYCIHIYREIR